MIYKTWFYVSLVSRTSQRFNHSVPTSKNKNFKNIIKPQQANLDYWKKVLWVAGDLKHKFRQNPKLGSKPLDAKHVTMLFVKPHGRFQLAFTSACDLLGARRTTYYDSNFENQPNAADSGKVLSQLTDMLVTHGLQHHILVKLTSFTTIPTYSACCNLYCIQKALSDLMTFQEYLGRIKGLTLAWVGPPNNLLNSYVLLCSLFEMKVQYNCMCRFGAGKMSPINALALNDKETSHDHLKEYMSVEDTVKGANIIATSMHPEEHNKITLKVLKHADPNWIFIHMLPRSSNEVSDDVFYHDNNFTWKTSENYLYVAMAITLTSLKDYEPSTAMPNF